MASMCCPPSCSGAARLPSSSQKQSTSTTSTAAHQQQQPGGGGGGEPSEEDVARHFSVYDRDGTGEVSVLDLQGGGTSRVGTSRVGEGAKLASWGEDQQQQGRGVLRLAVTHDGRGATMPFP